MGADLNNELELELEQFANQFTSGCATHNHYPKICLQSHFLQQRIFKELKSDTCGCEESKVFFC